MDEKHDPIMSEQMFYLAASSRKALGASRIIMIVEFDNKDSYDISMSMDSAKNMEPKEVAGMLCTAVSAIRSFFQKISDVDLVM